MPSKVYYIDLRTKYDQSLPDKLSRLVVAAGMDRIVKKRDLVAVKLHFGELGNTAFIRPLFLRRIVDVIQASGGEAFLTDANTLYAGSRGNAVAHMATAVSNGFAYSVVQAPLIIADGLRGKSQAAVSIKQRHNQVAYIGREIVEADSLVAVAHFKGHELCGFGGTLKNLGMGCASRRGKMAQHANLGPKIKRKKCVGCGACAAHCSQGAIQLNAVPNGPNSETNSEVNSEMKATIDLKLCIGCGACILACPTEAVQVRWKQTIPLFMEKMVEYTLGVLKTKKDKALFVNFITDVTPACDCHSYNDAPIVGDIGIVAATDPVAIDQASVDLVNAAAALPGTELTAQMEPGGDKFKGLYPEIDWSYQLEYAQSLGLGQRQYTLERLA